MLILDINIEQTLKALLAQEDTNNDKKITVEDQGPKCFKVKTLNNQTYTVKGTYHLSNFLQELVLAKSLNKEVAHIDLNKIEEPPAHRISRMIREYYWEGLTRKMDKEGLANLLKDTKNETLEAENTLRVYVPYTDDRALDYYMELKSTMPIEVHQLPKNITPHFVKKLNKYPGILSLQLTEINNQLVGAPFVVPGGRFNEMYGWDSYFESIGLLIDDKTHLAIGMANNFKYQVEHYGKILNANRSYYLTRTQPPFYSSLIREIVTQTKDVNWLKNHLETAIIEYETVWMQQGKRLTDNGLNRYLAEGIGQPPEAEKGHFDHVFLPFAEKAGLTLEKYQKKYNKGKIENSDLDQYFTHDRSVRESGHDTSYRLEGICAHLNLVELNAFLYKYETDFAYLIETYFEGNLTYNNQNYTPQYWLTKADQRKKLVNKYLWNEEKGMYFDYNFISKNQTTFISATSLTPLWANLCSKEQANKLVKNLLPLLIEKGGVVACTKQSRGEISAHRPQKQWDYPNGWAPHQMLIWIGLFNYNFKQEAQQLIYKWLLMITKNAVDYNGTIPEKYDVVEATHKVFAEYGNVGTQFEYITKEGFGWMNASYQLGLQLLDQKYYKQLNTLTPSQIVFNE